MRMLPLRNTKHQCFEEFGSFFIINKNMFRFLNLKGKFRDFILDFHPLPHKSQTEKGGSESKKQRPRYSDF